MRNEIVSKIEERDLVEVKNLLSSIFNNNTKYEDIKDYYKISVQNENVYLYGYYINDKLVGMIMLNIAILPSGKKATVWNLAVSEEYRHKGIATKLMNTVENVVKEHKDVKKLWLFSGAQRTVAHELYRKLGYNETENKAFYKKLF